MLSKSTHVYANHDIPVECDVYTQDATSDTHVFLYFHPGGLVGWGREFIAPWLVQACLQRKWTLISASYRLMPQVGAHGLLEDVKAAYGFAREWAAKDGRERPVIVGGASAGFFTSAVIANHCSPPPLALFAISGIHTFRHSFFNSSTLILPEPIEYSDMAEFIAGPIEVGKNDEGSIATFELDKLLADGSKNPNYKAPETPVVPNPPKYTRGALYEYYIYKNAWVDLLGEIDPGYTWAQNPDNGERVKSWPPTVLLHGDADRHVPLDIPQKMQECLGDDKVKLVVAEGQEHLFETFYYLEDDKPGMDQVRMALKCLDDIVSAANSK
ncbi:hypothetical protein FALBO_13787 [Fusarium albosuccineum]|uniref:Alpha/beta hydrolase fold-3 domain-containing protein n=1 Tax=Fusarium albosuccineum TaxID=1237068 RepID=A0A8H4KXU5_9HYPO|nr:hypothetical protein FALBO_13787 [Fusarium albosuccineum]